MGQPQEGYLAYRHERNPGYNLPTYQTRNSIKMWGWCTSTIIPNCSYDICRSRRTVSLIFLSIVDDFTFIFFVNRAAITLTRGGNTNFPCPVCLVPKDSLDLPSQIFELRKPKKMEEIWLSMQDMTAEACEETLRNVGLRNVYVIIFIGV